MVGPRIAGCLVLLFALAACNQRGPNRPATFAARGSTGESADDVGAVKLLEPGAEPRRPLRRATPLGRSERVHLELEVGFGSLEGEETRTVEIPTTVVELAVGPAEVDPLDDRLVRYEVDVDRVTTRTDGIALTPEAEAAAGEFQTLSGARIEIAVDSRGRARPMATSVPRSTSAGLLMFLQNIRTTLLGVAFPAEPVGVGARWRVRRQTRAASNDPVPVFWTILYTLDELDGDSGVLTVSLHQSGEPLEFPGEEPGTRVQILAYESMGVGSVRFALDRILYDAELDGTSMARTRFLEDGAVRMVHQRTRYLISAYEVE